MKTYRIYVGLGGGFGGASEHCVEDFENEDQAQRYAYEMACEDYENYAGMHGLRSFEEIQEENPDWDEDTVQEEYNEDRESWLDYWVEEV